MMPEGATCKPPAAFGFGRGLSFRVTADRKAVDVVISDLARRKESITYVAWLLPANKALKVGCTNLGLWGRWSGIVRVINAVQEVHKLKPNEWHDQTRLVDPSVGQEVVVWMKASERASISYARSEGFPDVSLAEAEERFLDWYYSPLFGKALGTRRLGIT